MKPKPRDYDLPVPDDAPRTEGALFDHLHKLFGWGSYDELYSEQPYWKWRQQEVAKVKRSLSARKIKLEDVYVAAEYCKAHGHHIGAVTWLYQHILPARRWWRERQQALAAAEFAKTYELALQTAYAEHDDYWLDRLSRAEGPMRQEVLESWQQR